jgi:Transposase DDE domain
VKNERMTAKKLFNLYSIRWPIEITFRAWKQSGDLISALARKSHLIHLRALMFVLILLLILTMKITALLQGIYGMSIKYRKTRRSSSRIHPWNPIHGEPSGLQSRYQTCETRAVKPLGTKRNRKSRFAA